jgi:kynurenine formamidase
VENRWGQWGPEDERGALNLLTDASLLRGAGLIKSGRIYSLALPVRRSGPFIGSRVRNRTLHFMRVDGGDYGEDAALGKLCVADDYVVIATHGTTHIDALCHVWADGKMFNGFSSREVRSSGARRLGVHTMGPIVTRGVLIDLPRMKAIRRMNAGDVIGQADIDMALEQQGVGPVMPGDVVLFRTGWLECYDELGAEAFEGKRPGIGREAAVWLVEQGVAAVGSDTGSVEVVPSEDGSDMPLHLELLRNQGLPLMEMLRLDEMARDQVSEFLFVANPLPVVGGTGAPIAPLAIV